VRSRLVPITWPAGAVLTLTAWSLIALRSGAPARLLVLVPILIAVLIATLVSARVLILGRALILGLALRPRRGTVLRDRATLGLGTFLPIVGASRSAAAVVSEPAFALSTGTVRMEFLLGTPGHLSAARVVLGHEWSGEVRGLVARILVLVPILVVLVVLVAFVAFVVTILIV